MTQQAMTQPDAMTRDQILSLVLTAATQQLHRIGNTADHSDMAADELEAAINKLSDELSLLEDDRTDRRETQRHQAFQTVIDTARERSHILCEAIKSANSDQDVKRLKYLRATIDDAINTLANGPEQQQEMTAMQQS